MSAREDKLIEIESILILCGEKECRDIEDHADKLRALIAGLITTRRERDEAFKAGLEAAAKVCDDRAASWKSTAPLLANEENNGLAQARATEAEGCSIEIGKLKDGE